MSDPIPQYSAVNGPFIDPETGILSFAGSTFLRQLWLRTGGAIAPTNNELSATEYADAGIESLQAEVYELRDMNGLLAAQLAALRDQVAVYARRLDDIDQGVTI